MSRIIHVSTQGWECEGDQRHAELIVRALESGNAKSVSTQGRGSKDREGRSGS